MPDYSEFPTTPTAWQESTWEEVRPLPTETPAPPRRRPVDLVALVPGILFVLLAVSSMASAHLPGALIHGGLVWALLVGAGVLLLVRELRRARRER